MERLTSVIGPAPSELSQEALLERVSKERERVKTCLVAFRERGYLKRSKAKTSSSKAKSKTLTQAKGAKIVASLQEKYGLSLAEVEKLLGEVKI